MPTKLIIPGLNGSGEGHWQDHWLKDDADAVLVEQRDWSRPDLNEWTDRVETALARHPGSILIAHSIGAFVAANLAARPSRHLVKGAMLVAPVDPFRVSILHPGAVELRPMPVGTLPFPSILVASRDDPYMAFEDARIYADSLGSDFVDLGLAGHINIGSGYGRWKKGYRLAARFDRHSYLNAPQSEPGFFSTLFGMRDR
jgi:predicted alpha/beta hydrolase family esterase